jgi:hypothetical protein
MSRDPFPGYTYRPSTQHDYTYVSNNPVNKTDHSGLCEEIADEACWGLYEQIVRRFPETRNKLYFYRGKWVHLAELPWSRLQKYASELNNASPDYFTSNQKVMQNLIPPTPDGVSVYLSVDPLDTPALNGTGGIEFLFNGKSGETTAFAVVGIAGTLGGGVKACVQINQVYKIDNDNRKYAGKFAFWNIAGSGPVGGVYGRAWTPNNRYKWPLNYVISDPAAAHSRGVGPAIGYGASLSVGVVEYIPLATYNHQTGQFRYDVGWYLLEYEDKWYVGNVLKQGFSIIFSYLATANPAPDYAPRVSTPPSQPIPPRGTPRPPWTMPPSTSPPSTPTPHPIM